MGEQQGTGWDKLKFGENLYFQHVRKHLWQPRATVTGFPIARRRF